MAIKWRAAGAVDIVVSSGQVIISQEIEVYDEDAPTTILLTRTESVSRNWDRVKASAVAELADMIDSALVPKFTAACQDAKRTAQGDTYEAQATSYISTKESGQVGV